MTSQSELFEAMFKPEKLSGLFPETRADQFFEALLGDADDGAYDITLVYAGFQDSQLHFNFQLRQRPQKCLSCSLTHGLPHVFARHPVIDVQGVVAAIDDLLAGKANCQSWEIGKTREISPEIHVIPLIIEIE